MPLRRILAAALAPLLASGGDPAACPECEAGAVASNNLLQMTAGLSASADEGATCKNWCTDAARSGSVSWTEKCAKARCADCAECKTTTTTTKPDVPACKLAEGTATELPSGEGWTAQMVAPAGAGADASFAFEEAPMGLSVNMRSGVASWQPEKAQAGAHWATLAVGDQKCLLELTVTKSRSNPKDALYVSPTHGSDENEGTGEAPFASVAFAASKAAPGQTIYVRGGVYLLQQEEVVADAPGTNPIVITRLPGERVRFNVDTDRIGFRVPEKSRGVTFRGFELYGSAESDEHWDVIKTSFWRVQDTRVGGKTGFDVDGQYVVIEDCVIHDLTQKGVNVYVGRYVTVRNCVIYNIGHTSLSGGHGIMRKWERNYKDADDKDFYRFDFYGNLLFAVEQRIYSFIPWKKYCHMVIDEGKGILLDISKNEKMKARVSQNLVLYGGVDGIRLKYNHNLQVENNAVMTEKGRIDPVPDGITCKNNMAPIPNMTLIGNLVQTFADSKSFDVINHFTDADSPERVRNNFYAGGGEAVGALKGVEKLEAESVFRDPANLDFGKSDAVKGNAGVSEKVLSSLFALVDDYAVTVAPSGWRHDHDGMVEAIRAAAPAEHVKLVKEGDSVKEKGLKSLFYKPISKMYKDLCKCTQIELILPHYDAH